ncbi:MAG: malQ [Chloroflexi bacterium]|nr:malQ [Chloroflexota bacterium]
MRFERASGVLLHPTSFPGPYGVGDLGGEAYRFVDFLQHTGQTLWQILPLAPTGFGDSPYAAFSAFAGNPLLISPDILLGQGLLEHADLANIPEFSGQTVEYGPVIEWKMQLLARSYEHYEQKAGPEIRAQVAQFEKENASWLDDYALFMAAKSHHNGAVWTEWEPGLAKHRPEALAEWREKLAGPVSFQKYLQFIFGLQWASLKEYANERGIKIIGDLPIFVAYDSADVWANPEIFYLDETGQATVIAGVPPDYFSPTGQRWGNPLYRWDVLARTNYRWWVERFRTAFRQTDIVRLDHFRGFESYWEVPANEETAINGRWVKGPGTALFEEVFRQLGEKPIIAEDLGMITPAVRRLLKDLGFPGMAVLQFAFGNDMTDAYLPHNYEPNLLVYTGTHDNDTTVGWLESVNEAEKEMLRRYLALDSLDQLSPVELSWRLIRLAWGSVADLAIAPLQDMLGIDSEGRMNAPGRPMGNWGWRYHPDSLSDWLRGRLLDVTLLYARFVPEEVKQKKLREQQEQQEQ